jgi:hypothetical protein
MQNYQAMDSISSLVAWINEIQEEEKTEIEMFICGGGVYQYK